MTEGLAEFKVSNDARNDEQELRRRMDEDGYLFLRGLLNPDRLLAVRSDIMRVVQDWLVPGTDPMDGIANVSRRCTEGDADYHAVYREVQKLESFHRIPHDPELLAVVERIMDADPIPVPGHKARIWFPQFTDHTTPMHQDFVHYQGSLKAITCWAPVGDCPTELGPLAVLPGSQTVKKVLKHKFSLGAGGMIADVDGSREKFPILDTGWLTADFVVGDVLFFPALTVHKALPNETEDLLRVSLDNRYQRDGDNISAHMLQTHLSSVTGLTWEEVYENWKSDDLKYYWRTRSYKEVPKYMGYLQASLAEAMDLARDGDDHAILALRRYVASFPDADQSAEMREILQDLDAAV